MMAQPRGYIVVISRNGSYGNRYPLSNTECFFGQSNDCDVRVHVNNVAKRHCVITAKQDEQATICNLSGQVTLVNGIPIGSPEQHLRHGDVITVGDRLFRWEYPDSSHYPSSSKSAQKDVEQRGLVCMVKLFRGNQNTDENESRPQSPKRRRILEPDIRLENTLAKPVNKLLLGVTQPASRPKSYTTFKLLKSASKRKTLNPASKSQPKEKRSQSLPLMTPMERASTSGAPVNSKLLKSPPSKQHSPNKSSKTLNVKEASSNKSIASQTRKKSAALKSPEKSVTPSQSLSPKAQRKGLLVNTPNKTPKGRRQAKSPVSSASTAIQSNSPIKSLSLMSEISPAKSFDKTTVTESSSNKSSLRKSSVQRSLDRSQEITPSKDILSDNYTKKFEKTSTVKNISVLANPLMIATTSSTSPTSRTPSQRLGTLRRRESKTPLVEEKPNTPRGKPSRKSSTAVKSATLLTLPSPALSGNNSPAKTPVNTPRGRTSTKSSVVKESATLSLSSSSNISSSNTPSISPRGRLRKSSIVKKTATPPISSSPLSTNNSPAETPATTPRGKLRKSSTVKKTATPPKSSSPSSTNNSPAETPAKTPRGKLRKSSTVKKTATPPKSSSPSSKNNSPAETLAKTPRVRPSKSSIVKKSETPPTSFSSISSRNNSPSATSVKTPSGRQSEKSPILEVSSSRISTSPLKSPSETYTHTPSISIGNTSSTKETPANTPRNRPLRSSIIAEKSAPAGKTVLANPLLKTNLDNLSSKFTPGRKSIKNRSVKKQSSPLKEQMQISSVPEMPVRTPTPRSSKKTTQDEETRDTPTPLKLRPEKQNLKRRQTRSNSELVESGKKVSINDSPLKRASLLANPLLKITLNNSPQSSTTTPVGKRNRRSVETRRLEEVSRQPHSRSPQHTTGIEQGAEATLVQTAPLTKSPSVKDLVKIYNTRSSLTPSVNVALLRRKSKSLTKSPSPKSSSRKTPIASSTASTPKSARSVVKSIKTSPTPSSPLISLTDDAYIDSARKLPPYLTETPQTSPIIITAPSKSSSNTPSVSVASLRNKSLLLRKSPSPKTPKMQILVPKINIVSPSPSENDIHSQGDSAAKSSGNKIIRRASATPSVVVSTLRRKSRSLAKTPSPLSLEQFPNANLTPSTSSNFTSRVQTPIPNRSSILRESLHWPINVEEAISNLRSTRKSLIPSEVKTPRRFTPKAGPSSTKKTSLAKTKSETKRKIDNDFEARAERAAKRLKMETPKSLSKNKVAALLVCHGRSPKKVESQEGAKRPLWSDVLKSHLSTAKKKQQANHQSMSAAVKRNVRPQQKPFQPSLEVPKSFKFNSTGHANSPETIVITKKSKATPEPKIHISNNSISRRTETTEPQLEGLLQPFNTPGKAIVPSLKSASSVKKPQHIRVHFSLQDENQGSSSKRYIGTPRPAGRSSTLYNSIVEESPLAEDINSSHSSSSSSPKRKSRGSMRSVKSYDFSAYSPSSPTLLFSQISGISSQLGSSSELDSDSEYPKRKRDMPRLDSSKVSRTETRKLSFAGLSKRRSQSNVDSHVSLNQNSRPSESFLFGSFTDDSNCTIGSKVTRKRGHSVTTDTSGVFRFSLESNDMSNKSFGGGKQLNMSEIPLPTSPYKPKDNLSSTTQRRSTRNSSPVERDSPIPSYSSESLNVLESMRSPRSCRSSALINHDSENPTSYESQGVFSPTKSLRSVRSVPFDQVTPLAVRTSSRKNTTTERSSYSDSNDESIRSPTRTNRTSSSSLHLMHTFDDSTKQPKEYDGLKKISSTPKPKRISAEQSLINSETFSPEKDSNISLNLGDTTDYSFTKSGIVFESTQLPSSTPRRTLRKGSVRMTASDPSLIISDSPVPVATVKPSSRKRLGHESMVSNIDFTSLPDLTIPQDNQRSVFTNLAFARASQGFDQFAFNQASTSGLSNNTSSSGSSSRRKQKSHRSSSGSHMSNDTSFDFSSVKTPYVPREMLVSPLNRISNGLSDLTGVKNILHPNERSPVSSYVDVGGVRRLLKTPRPSSPAANYVDVEGIKALFAQSPVADYTNVGGLSNLYDESSCVNVKGVRRGFKERNVQSSPSFVGLDLLFESPSKPTVMVPPMSRPNSEIERESTSAEQIIPTGNNVSQSAGPSFTRNLNENLGGENVRSSSSRAGANRNKKLKPKSEGKEAKPTTALESETTLRVTRAKRGTKVMDSRGTTADLKDSLDKSKNKEIGPVEGISIVKNICKTRGKPNDAELFVERDTAGPSTRRRLRRNPITSDTLERNEQKAEKRKVSSEESAGSSSSGSPLKRLKRGKALDKSTLVQNIQRVDSKPAPLNKRGRKRIDSVEEVSNTPSNVKGIKTKSSNSRQEAKKELEAGNTRPGEKVDQPGVSDILEVKQTRSKRTLGKEKSLPEEEARTQTKPRSKSRLVDKAELANKEISSAKPKKIVAPKALEKEESQSQGGLRGRNTRQKEVKASETEEQAHIEYLERPRALRRKGREDLVSSESEAESKPKRQKKSGTPSNRTKAKSSKKVQFDTTSPEQPPNKRGVRKAKTAGKRNAKEPASEEEEVSEKKVNTRASRREKTKRQTASKVSPSLIKEDKSTKKKSTAQKVKAQAKTRTTRSRSSSDGDASQGSTDNSTARNSPEKKEEGPSKRGVRKAKPADKRNDSESTLTLTPTTSKEASKRRSLQKIKTSLKTKAALKLKATKKKSVTPPLPSPPTRRVTRRNK